MRTVWLIAAALVSFLLWVALLATAGLAFAACSSPTAPDPTPAPVPIAIVVPAQPAPEPAPAPTPQPPAPTPAPQPEPVWTATVDQAHWYGAETLPQTFVIEWRYTTLWFGPVTAPIQIHDDRSIFAKSDGFSIQLVFDGDHGTWIFNGLSGQASGTVVLR